MKKIRNSIRLALLCAAGALILIDQKILEWIDEGCRKIQALCGISCFRLAEMANVLVAACVALPHLPKSGPLRVSITFTLTLVVFRMFIALVEESAPLSGSGAATKSDVGRWWPVILTRTFLLLGAAVAGVPQSPWEFGWQRAMVNHAMPLSLWLLLHLVSCTPMPPGSSKLGRWLQRALSRSVPAH
jgi:hypothetical protein